MVGGHRNSAEGNSSDASVDEVAATQTWNEVHDEELLPRTQQEIQFAELRYEKSLLQDSIWPDSIQLPLPTAMEPEVAVLFGRQAEAGPDHHMFVKHMTALAVIWNNLQAEVILSWD